MLDENAIALEFQRRRNETWVAARGWVLSMALGALGGLFVGDLNDQLAPLEWAFGLACFAMFAIPIVRLTYLIRAHYLCPACGQVPMGGFFSFGPSAIGYSRGVELNPKNAPTAVCASSEAAA